MSVLCVKKVHENAIIPKYDSRNQYTLYALEDTVIPPNTPYLIKTGIATAFPSSHCALIVGNGKCKTIAGLVDSDYRGEVSVITINPTEVTVKQGEAVARMIVIEIELPEIEVEDSLEETEIENEVEQRINE